MDFKGRDGLGSLPNRAGNMIIEELNLAVKFAKAGKKFDALARLDVAAKEINDLAILAQNDTARRKKLRKVYIFMARAGNNIDNPKKFIADLFIARALIKKFKLE